jgi:hypothetical protein
MVIENKSTGKMRKAVNDNDKRAVSYMARLYGRTKHIHNPSYRTGRLLLDNP